MAKKKKRSLADLNVTDQVTNKSLSLLDSIIEHLELIKKLNGLVIGTNAVLRGLKKQSVNVVLVSRNAPPAFYLAISSWCKNTDSLLYHLHNDHITFLSSKIQASTTYGIKINALTDQENLSGLLEEINDARNSLKSHRQKKDNLKNEIITTPEVAKVNEPLQEEEKGASAKCILHSNHNVPKPKFIGAAELFISLDEYSVSESDFPNYSALSKNLSIYCK